MRFRIALFLGVSVFTAGCTSAKPEVLLDPGHPGSAKATAISFRMLKYTTQLFPVDGDGVLVGEGSPEAQVEQVLKNVENVLRSRPLKLNFYVDRPETVPLVRTALARHFRDDYSPAVTFAVTRLRHGALVSVDGLGGETLDIDGGQVCYLRDGSTTWSRAADAAWCSVRHLVYVSPIREKGPVRKACPKALARLLAILGHVKLGVTDVAQLRAYVDSAEQADAVTEEVKKAFVRTVPPLVFVECAAADSIAIEATAAFPEKVGEPPGITFITPPGTNSSPLSSPVVILYWGRSIYVSGAYGDKSDSRESEVRSLFAKLRKTLRAMGSDVHHLVRATCYCSTQEARDTLNQLLPEFFDPNLPPALTNVVVKGVGMPGRSVTMDLVAGPAY
jgi:enamine deaminase RidA (YjgF/YER057c/UK114 family)